MVAFVDDEEEDQQLSSIQVPVPDELNESLQSVAEDLHQQSQSMVSPSLYSHTNTDLLILSVVICTNFFYRIIKYKST